MIGVPAAAQRPAARPPEFLTAAVRRSAPKSPQNSYLTHEGPAFPSLDSLLRAGRTVRPFTGGRGRLLPPSRLTSSGLLVCMPVSEAQQLEQALVEMPLRVRLRVTYLKSTLKIFGALQALLSPAT